MAASSNPIASAGNDVGRYVLNARADILPILHWLIAQHQLVTVHFNNGKDLLLTTLLEVDEVDDSLVFDWGRNEEVNRKLLAADHHVFVAVVGGGVRIQFASGTVRRTTFEDRDAFITDLPADLLNLQRREFHRIAPPASHPVLCEIPLDHDRYVLPVFDISMTGVGLLLKADPAHYQVHQRLDDCCLDLPETGAVSSTLEVRHIAELEVRPGQMRAKMGCRFVDLPVYSEDKVHRFMLRLERQKKTGASRRTN